MNEEKRDQIRKMIVNAMVILGAVAFAVILVISVVRDGEEEETKKQQVQTDRTVHEYSEKENEEDLEVQGEEEKKETKTVADQFIRSYLSYDDKKPDQKVKEMSQYLSQRMKESWKEPDIPDGVKQAKVKIVEFLPETTQKEGRFFYSVKAQVETVFSDGESEKAWSLYGVVVGQEEGRWVIEGVGPIGDAGAEPLELGGKEDE